MLSIHLAIQKIESINIFIFIIFITNFDEQFFELTDYINFILKKRFTISWQGHSNPTRFNFIDRKYI